MAVVSEEVLHKRYLTLYNQRVSFPTVCLPAAHLADRTCYSYTRLGQYTGKKSQTTGNRRLRYLLHTGSGSMTLTLLATRSHNSSLL